MPEPMNDFWGDLTVEASPADVLHEQAEALGKRTKNVLEGMLLTDIANQVKWVHIRFAVHAPTLDYQTTLFELSYSMLHPYPCSIRESLTEEEVTHEFEGQSLKITNQKSRTVANEEQLHQAVKEVLQSENVQKLIKGLLGAARVS